MHWLERAAPVKLVDGAWLSRLNHARTPLKLRAVTRIAWHIFSEELGDGDLEKNHVHLYRELLRSCGSKPPAGESIEFVDAKLNPANDAHVWTTATLQLCLGLFPDDFLPDAFGYNLAYERIALDTLICAYELKELGLDPRYFNMHITIDNADSRHTAMALDTVVKLLEQSDIQTRQQQWRRVQAGSLLAVEISSTPSAPTPTEMVFLRTMS